MSAEDTECVYVRARMCVCACVCNCQVNIGKRCVPQRSLELTGRQNLLRYIRRPQPPRHAHNLMVAL